MLRTVEDLRAERPRWISATTMLHLPAKTPPWTDTGVVVERGDRITVLARGHVLWTQLGNLPVAARYHLWGRIGGGDIFRLGSDTRTLTAAHAGPLRLCVYHGMWESRDGVLKPPLEAYATLAGGFDVLVIRWGDVAVEDGLDALAARAPAEPVFAAERARLRTPPTVPPGFEPLWFLGDSDIFDATTIDGAPAITVRADASAGIVRRPVDLALEPGTMLEWTWRVNGLPSRVREDTVATHDYTSIAVEVDDGRDLTWHWSADLPAEHHYACPLPRWKGIETHLVIRRGTDGLGTWIDERRDVHADVARALGPAPTRIVAVWLIAVSLFQRAVASTDSRQIALVQQGRRHAVFPA